MYTFGYGDYGRLGHGNTTSKKTPTLVHDCQNIGSVSCGLNHTLALSRDGMTVWAFGDGDFGKLGLGNTLATQSPNKIAALENIGIKSVHCGHQWSVFLAINGDVYVCGQDAFNGIGGPGQTVVPTKLESITKRVYQISCGAEYTLALDEDGNVWAWGNNSDGQIGCGHFNKVHEPTITLTGHRIKQVRAGKTHSIAWTSPPKSDFGGNNLGTPDNIPSKYAVLKSEDIEDCRLRLKHLHKFNETVFRCWKMLDLSSKPRFHTPFTIAESFVADGRLRALLTSRLTVLPHKCSDGHSSTNYRTTCDVGSFITELFSLFTICTGRSRGAEW
jgi:E3 ubiquitin-protein ligase HERC1